MGGTVLRSQERVPRSSFCPVHRGKRNFKVEILGRRLLPPPRPLGTKTGYVFDSPHVLFTQDREWGGGEEGCILPLAHGQPRLPARPETSSLDWLLCNSISPPLSLRLDPPRGKAGPASVRWKLIYVYQRVFQNKCKIKKGTNAVF